MINTIKKQSVLVLLLLLAVYSSTIAQQTFQWGVKAGGSNIDVINDITNIGNDIYITGRFTDSFMSGSKKMEGKANNDIYLVKLNQKGDTKWIRTLVGNGSNNATCISTTEDQILLGGTISETVSQGKKQFKGKGKAVFISSFTEQGKTNWLTRLNYSGHATLDVLEVNSDGSFLAGGLLQGTMNVDGVELAVPNAKRAYTVIFSTEGKPIKAELSKGEGSHRLVTATFDTKGNLYKLFSVNGNFSTKEDSMIILPRSVKSALILSKVSKNGKIEWNKTITGSGYLEGVKLVTDANNRIFVCTNYNKGIKTADSTLTTNSQLETALFCFNNIGTLQWSKTISSPVKARAMDVLITRNKNILVTGYFRKSYSFNGQEFYSSSTTGDLFLLQFNTEGELVWHDEPGQDAASFSKTFTLDQTGNIIIAGGFKGELNLRDKKLKSAGNDDILIAKYFNCLQKEINIIGNEPLCTGGETILSVSGDYTSYRWNDKDWSERECSITQPGTYYVTAFDKKGCAASDTVNVLLANLPELGLPESVDLYTGDQVLLTAHEGFSSYLWENGLESAEREISYQSGIDSMQLSIVAESFEGCSANDSVLVRFNHTINGIGSFNSLGKAWPNPVRDNLSWYANIKKPENLTVTLTDGKSVTISKETITRYTPGSVQFINMANLASGNYLLTIEVGDKLYNHKILKK